MAVAAQYWPQIYIALRSYGNESFLLSPDAWKSLGLVCLGARAAYGVLATGIEMFDFELKVTRDQLFDPMRHRVTALHGEEGASIFESSFFGFLRNADPIENSLALLAQFLLSDWLGSDRAIKAKVATIDSQGDTILNEDITLRLAGLIGLRCNYTALADSERGGRLQRQSVPTPINFSQFFNVIFEPTSTSAPGQLKVIGQPHELLAVVLPTGETLARSAARNVTSLDHCWKLRDLTSETFCAKFFANNARRHRMVNLGLAALGMGHIEPLRAPELFPDTSAPCSQDQHSRLWNELIRQAKIGDALFTRDTSNTISGGIAILDEGSWSHAATYIHDGWILETQDTTGLSRLERYAQPQIRAGLYRPMLRLSPQGENALLEFASSNFRGGYDYVGALRAGLGTLTEDGKNVNLFQDHITPNGLVYTGFFSPVCFV